MIVRLTGTIVEVGEDAAVIERDGVAREVLVPRFSIGDLAANRGRQVSLHTREFLEGNHGSGNLVPRLLGFSRVEDRQFFDRFLEVRGIGLRKALKALSEPVGRIAGWIEAGDVKALARLPGIGARAAEMIVATLRGKVEDLAIRSDGSPAMAPVSSLSQAQRDALEVLIAWGDHRSDAERWLLRSMEIQPDLKSAEEWVRAAYRVKSGVIG